MAGSGLAAPLYFWGEDLFTRMTQINADHKRERTMSSAVGQQPNRQ